MVANIFSIEEFSIYDGPGIRTTIFIKGCPLSCEWCHNPEGQNSEPEIVRSPNGCIGCGKCEKNATIINNRIKYSQKSIDVCPKNLLRVCGKRYTPIELFEKVSKNAGFLTNGGVTFSGGEPFAHSEFLIECLELFKGKINTCVQTSGFADTFQFKKALSLADYMLFDIKLFDEQEHIRYTGVSNTIIHKNLSELAKSNLPFIIRVPLIPMVTDTKENIIGVCKLLKQNKIEYVELMPYNKLAGGKYKMSGREYKPSFDETRDPELHTLIWEEYGIKIKIL